LSAEGSPTAETAPAGPTVLAVLAGPIEPDPAEEPPHPLLRSPADTPLIVSWIPVSTFSLVECPRWSFRSSTCTWFKGSR
jgi:hypothetical protein